MTRKPITTTDIQIIIDAIPLSSKAFTETIKKCYRSQGYADGRYSIDFSQEVTETLFIQAEAYILNPKTSNESLYNAYRVISMMMFANMHVTPFFERLFTLIDRDIEHSYGHIRTTIGHIVGNIPLLLDDYFWKKKKRLINMKRTEVYEYYLRILEKHDTYQNSHRRTLDEYDLSEARGHTPYATDTRNKILKSYRNMLFELNQWVWLEEYLEENNITSYVDGPLIRTGEDPALSIIKSRFDGQVDRSIMDGFFDFMHGYDRDYIPMNIVRGLVERDILDNATKESIVWLAVEATMDTLAMLEELYENPELSPVIHGWLHMGLLYARTIRQKMKSPLYDGASIAFSPLGEYQWLPRYVLGFEMMDIVRFQKKSDIENINALFEFQNMRVVIQEFIYQDPYVICILGITHDIAASDAIDVLISYYNSSTKMLSYKYYIGNNEVPTWQELKKILNSLSEKS
jgi:hypothetical protein